MAAKTRFALTASLLGVCLSGCQSWQSGGFPLQNTTRVPPPGTGTFQVPNAYYNNGSTSSISPNDQFNQTAAAGLRPAVGAFPSTNLASGSNVIGASSFAPTASNLSSSNLSGNSSLTAAPVVTASFAQGSYDQYTEPPRIEIGAAAATGSAVGNSGASNRASDLNDEVPNLQWQEFNGR